MSKVDLAALKKIAAGDPKAKVTVTKAWLRAIHSELAELERRRKDEQLTAREEKVLDEGMDETFGHMAKAFSAMDRMFDGLFGGRHSNGFFSRKIRAVRSKT